MIAADNKIPWRRLGEFIEECDERNPDGNYSNVVGLNREKTFMPTVANLEDVNVCKYKVLRKGRFCFNGMHVGRDINIPIGMYNYESPCLISPAYVTFDVVNKDVLPEYLFVAISRYEMDRLGWFFCDSSVRGGLDWNRFLDIEIPVPMLAVQQKVVDVWRGLRKMKEENEALAAPLMQLCRSYLQDCKKKWPMKEIGSYLTPHDERNSDLLIKLSQGVANTKVFQDPKQVSSNSRADKIVHPGQFAYNRATTRNGEKISIAYREGPECTVSSAYQVFSISDELHLNPYYLMLWVSRTEFDRYARYMSKGSAHEFFEFSDMCRVKIPLPPIEVQQAVVDVYRCASEAKKIAEEADRLSREICPALVRWAAEGGTA